VMYAAVCDRCGHVARMRYVDQREGYVMPKGWGKGPDSADLCGPCAIAFRVWLTGGDA